MFFSCAMRPTCTSTGCSGAIPSCVAEARAVAAREALHLHAGRNDVHRTAHAVVQQRLLHRTGWDDQGIEHVALGNSEAARDESHDRARQQRHVVMQVLLEVRVIALDDRNAQCASQRRALVVSDEGSLDVHEVRLEALELRTQRADRAELHRAIFRVARQVA